MSHEFTQHELFALVRHWEHQAVNTIRNEGIGGRQTHHIRRENLEHAKHCLEKALCYANQLKDQEAPDA